MFSTRLFFVSFLASLVSLASAETIFTSPSTGDEIRIGQPVEVTWDTDAGDVTYGMQLCYGWPQPTCIPVAENRRNNGSFTWTPRSNIELRDDWTLFITLNTNPFQSATSSRFSILAAASTTSGPSSTSGGGTSTPGQTTTSGSGPNTTGGSNDNSDSNSNGTIIGAAVGAVAAVVIIAVTAFIWMRKRNQKKLAEARQSTNHDDVEAGEKKKANGSGSANGAAVLAAGDKKKSPDEDAYAPAGDKKFNYAGSSNNIAMAELPAVQQEVFEMAAVPTANASGSGGQHFFAMELDSREIPRPGTSTVKPDVDPTSKPSSPVPVKPSTDKPEARGVSIDGTTVNSETERPRSMESIEQIKESSREGSQRDLTQQNEARSGTPAQITPGEGSNGAGPSNNNRDSTPQIGSIPKLGGFEFDTAKF